MCSAISIHVKKRIQIKYCQGKFLYPAIVRLPGHHRYQLTPMGRRVAVLFTKVYGRVLAPGLAELDPRLPTDLANRSDLAHAWRQLDQRLNQFTNAALTAA